ncbi:unnamed protein product [Urochloa humidicola]
MIETFIHEEYVSKRREQRRRMQQQHHQQQHQQRRQRLMRSLQIETDKGKLMKLPAASSAAEGQQQSPREQHQPATAYRSPVGSPTADAASFRDHLFDYLKPY